MKNKLYIFVFFLCFFSCQNKDKIVKESIKGEVIVSDSIYSRLPGELLVLDDFIVWTDIFAREGVLHVLDRKDGHEIERVVNIGNGPNEFLSPKVSCIGDDKIFIYDLNAKKNALIDFEKDSKVLTFFPASKKKLVTKKLFMDSLNYISLKSNDYEFIEIVNGNSSYTLESWIKNKQLKNRFEVFQGLLGYNTPREILVYAPKSFPFFHLYKKNKKGYFEFDKKIGKQAKFSIVDNELVFSKSSLTGCFDMTLSKDYIVLLQYDVEKTYAERRKIGRDFSKLPQTAFVYDYQGNLKKVLDLKMPVLRIASNLNDNELYFIALNPEFTLYKCNI